MSRSPKHRVEPCLVLADERGDIYDEPSLRMLVRRGEQWGTPRPDELMPLPEESELFLLPGRRAVGLDTETGEAEVLDGLAVAAFAAPAHTLTGHPVYETDEGAAMLPLFAYGAVGYAEGRFWICAKKVDTDTRQQFRGISRGRIEKNARELLKAYPKNRLVDHILSNCVARYDCPAARNFALGRFEAPLPSSRTCNARCIGCISEQEEGSPIATTPQCRLAFVPTPEEVAEVMRIHAGRERRVPVFSFGQGCEGDPLMNPDLLCASVRLFRAEGGEGTVNCNTNASRPEAVKALCEAGLTSMRVSLNSAREAVYNRYYRPKGYRFEDVCASIRVAREHGIFVSLNLLYFPGVTDTEEELAALSRLVGENGVSMIQWRNLNIDPEYYLRILSSPDGEGGVAGTALQPSMGLVSFMKRLRKACPWLRYGYFNPYVGTKAQVEAPMPGEWRPADMNRVLRDLEAADTDADTAVPDTDTADAPEQEAPEKGVPDTGAGEEGR